MENWQLGGLLVIVGIICLGLIVFSFMNFAKPYPDGTDSNSTIYKDVSNLQVVFQTNNAIYANVFCTHSMEPTFGCRDKLIEENLSLSNESPHVGEIISYSPKGLTAWQFGSNVTSVLHRIWFKYGDCYIFKGDNNIFPDPSCVSVLDMQNRVIGIIY